MVFFIAVAAPETHHPNTGLHIYRSAVMSHRHLPSVSLLEQYLLAAVALVLVAMLSLPEARSAGDTLGWVPFWLLAFPLTAWATARALRYRNHREYALPMATVHAIGGIRPKAQASQALRRAA
jgi:hypothetical protein